MIANDNTLFAPGRLADTRGLTFARSRSDRAWVPLERTPPIEPRWKSWASGIGCLLFMIGVFVVCR